MHEDSAIAPPYHRSREGAVMVTDRDLVRRRRLKRALLQNPPHCSAMIPGGVADLGATRSGNENGVATVTCPRCGADRFIVLCFQSHLICLQCAPCGAPLGTMNLLDVRALSKTINLPSEIRAQSVRQFCESHNISKAGFYVLLKNGCGPKVMRVGGRTLISTEAAAHWRRDRETEAETSARTPQRARRSNRILAQKGGT